MGGRNMRSLGFFRPPTATEDPHGHTTTTTTTYGIRSQAPLSYSSTAIYVYVRPSWTGSDFCYILY